MKRAPRPGILVCTDCDHDAADHDQMGCTIPLCHCDENDTLNDRPPECQWDPLPEQHPEAEGPHSRACGWRRHEHGPDCHTNCPTCGGQRGARRLARELD